MQVRMLQGNLDNLVSTIGEGVLPMFTMFTSALNGTIQMSERFLSLVGRMPAAFGELAGRAIFGGQVPEGFNPNAEVPDQGLADIDARNQALVDEQLKLSAEEAAMRSKNRGAHYTDLQGLNKQIQEAISGGPAAMLRDQVEIQKKQLELQKKIANGIANLKKPGNAPIDIVPF